MISNRKNDMAVEREIAAFLDKNLYENKELFTEYARTDGKEEQLSGSDLLLSTTNGKLNRSVVDEKVAKNYANKILNTFSLELSFLGKNGLKRCGWLVDTTKKTEYYLFGWILEADIPYIESKEWYDTDKIDRNNIKKLEWALVKRDKIMKFLEERGWTLEMLAKQDEQIRKRGSVKTTEFIDDVRFTYSDRFFEKPINLLLKKETYLKLSELNGIINV